MTVPAVRSAYDAAAEGWQAGPERFYFRLAETLLGHTPVPLIGAAVLDVGAGTGVAARIAVARGAGSVVAVDVAAAMLARAGPSVHTVVADARALPFPGGSFNLCVAACALGHVPNPEQALRETRRVGEALLVSAFQSGWTHPAKAAVDAALVPLGYRPPAWYVALKADIEPQIDDPEKLKDLVAAAGYRNVEVVVALIQTGLAAPEQLAQWRLGMAHLAPFLASVGPRGRAGARQAAVAALAGAPPLVVPLVVLSAV
jgi:SAM-dependent methyltransferase